jgi:zinc protease
MVNSFVAKKDLDSEMTVVRNEFEAGENNPLGVLYQRVLSTAYLWHKLRQIDDRLARRYRERPD